MKKNFKLFLTLVLFSICAIGVRAQAPSDPLDNLFFDGFNDDSYFVKIPVDVGTGIGAVVGAVPTALVACGFHFANATPSYTREAAGITMGLFTKSIGFLVGLPFKTVKLLFWDSPKYVYGGITGDTDPPAEVNPKTKTVISEY
ncbi:MAG: hypothetical protein GY750_05190 [Lentisphaerae bacterium]|nr:hypothetical protein [Lentisphaerota bacterium]MCP4100808.1 hypothetical protein [Lentisphaerota bacterium]